MIQKYFKKLKQIWKFQKKLLYLYREKFFENIMLA